ncbi:MAG: tRNA uridine-5-carboxymethylaminomethyl(34) synthesis enzyme MnmG [Planctomycetota bacterium]|nr:tRNA uridine-5-carboxymethylaminomethyl(34) synthesis enzyme MnmG [Planctomycetota bacterium]
MADRPSTSNPHSHDYEIVVIGGGHAGAEAAWAASRLGARVALISMDPSRIGQMSCNPAIGGLAKGQMVREIDALGGLMGIATDNTGIQFRMLNRSKGPAVWGPRAQADKYKYAIEVQRLLTTCPNLQIIRGEVADIEASSDGVRAVRLADGQRLSCRVAIVTTGTFLRGLMHTGENQTPGGRVGELPATGLSACLISLGLEMGRLKTGTPPRLARDSIDFTAFEPQAGDDEPMPFSYLNEYAGHWAPPLPQVNCWIGGTTEEIHEIIRANLHRAPMYSGQIHSTGPRYCPSIEDKVVRFADKNRHQIFLEPEGLDTNEIYCNGISTSLPGDVQEKIVRLIPGLQNAKILRYGYAVEYDMVWPTQIQGTLQTKRVAGLFLAGQINGTSGYEEAAAQGIVAGINAACYASGGAGQDDFVLRRDQAYIGVMIDDLVTKPPTEPYRMFTSRAEHRLHLRNDNADERLTPVGREIGLVDDDRWMQFSARRQAVAAAELFLQNARIDGVPGDDYLRRSEVTWKDFAEQESAAHNFTADVARQVEIRIKYAGYIARQDRQIQRFAQNEAKLIPLSIDYATVVGMRTEARQKFSKFTPRSLGQALRISGITPADVTVLAIHLDRVARTR